MNKNWRKYQGSLIPLSPPHQLVSESNLEIADLVKSNNSHFARWTTKFDCKEKTNFWYIICDSQFDLSDYSKNTRNQIRKGLIGCRVCIVAKEIIIEQGFEIYQAAFLKYNTHSKSKNKAEFQDELLSFGSEWEFWGIYNEDKIIGYCQNKITGKYCDYSTIKIHPDYFKLYPSYALFYTMNQYYLNEKKFTYVNDGARSISHNTNIQSFLIKKFKFRKAYCHVHIIYSPLLGCFVKLLFPFRRLLRVIKLNFFRKVSAILKQEEFIRNNKEISSSRIIMSNGNFKSGSTWVTSIISEIYNDLPKEFPKEFQHPRHRNLINIFKIKDFISSSIFRKSKVWLSKSHIFHSPIINQISSEESVKIININRDIRDVLVSHYFHLKNAKKYNSDFNSYFYSWGKYKAIQYLLYNKAWENESCLKLTYLELKNNNIETIKTIARYLEVPITNKQALHIQKETDINKLRESSKEKNLNEEAWFYRKGIVGDWKNHFDEKMLDKLKKIQLGHLNWNERLVYVIKFTFRMKLKFLLYRFCPNLYVYFDKKF